MRATSYRLVLSFLIPVRSQRTQHILLGSRISMADVRPLRGIRYAPALRSEIAQLVTPPYDVISPQAQAAYYERHPYNVIRLEMGKEYKGDNSLNNVYTRAAAIYTE